MEVPITTLRAELSDWLRRAQAGEEIVVTDRGTPVARLLAIDTAPLLDDLAARGVIGSPTGDRPAARQTTRVRSRGSVADLVADQRR